MPSRAGSRDPKFRPFGRISNNRVMMLRTATTHQVVVLEYDPSDPDTEDWDISTEGGLTYLVQFFVPGRSKPLTWDMTAMTTEELEATRTFFNDLFDLADPVVRQRDKAAQDALAQGDDTFQRIYRALPQLIVRERKKREHAEGVHDGPSDAPDGPGSGLPSGGRVRADGDVLADGESRDDRGQDNPASTD